MNEFFSELKNVYRCCMALILVSAVLFAFAWSVSSITLRWILGVLSAVGVVALLIIGGLYWRCPHCGKMLGRLDAVPKHCMHCGGKLVD